MMHDAADTLVEVHDLEKRFGAVEALGGVSLTIRAGTVYALLGENGAGKTTLINVLATLLRPDGGHATVGGDDVVRHPRAVRRRIGLAGQFAAVDAYLTGRESVEMVGRLYGLGRREARDRARELLERFGLSEVADRQAATYSGGMRRRLDLAASLVGGPEVMFLDEPTTGIDPASRLDIWALVRDLVAGGTTVLLTTQYLEEADELADRIGVIAHGRIVADGTADELKDALGVNTIRLRVGPADVDRARGATAALAATGTGVGGQFEFPATNGNRTLLAIVRELDAVGVEPLELSLERPSLNDVFLALTRARGAAAR